MHVDYTYYKVRKGSKLSKMIDAFYEARQQQLEARVALTKELGFEHYVATDHAIIGFKMRGEEAHKRGWIRSGRNAEGYFQPRAKGADAEIRKHMAKLPCIGARAFTHDKAYLGVENFLMVGLTICSITPLVLDGKYVLSVPAACVGKEVTFDDKQVTELKMSEFRALQAADAKKTEATA